MALGPVRRVGAALLDDGPVPDADHRGGQVGQLDVAEQLDEAGTLRRDAGLGVVGAFLPGADQQRPTDGAVRHHLVALQRRGLHLAVLVGQPVVDRLGDGRCGAFVDIAALGDLDEQSGSERLGVLLAIEGTAAALPGDRVLVFAIPLRIGGDGAALEPYGGASSM